MAIAVVAGTIIRVTFQQIGRSGQPWDCVVDLSMDEIGIDREDAIRNTIGDIVGIWQENVSQWTSPNDNFIGARWLDIDSLEGSSGFEGPQPGKPVHGGTGLQWTTPQVALLAHKLCTHTRSQRNGRMYIPAVAESEVDDGGLLTAGAVTNWTERLNQLRTDWQDLSSPGTSELAWRVVHVTNHDSEGKPSEWNSSNVASVTIDSRVATQRRRLR